MSQQGFNKVEVLILLTIVITIIILFLNFAFDIQKSARDSKRKGDVESIAKQSEIHFNRYAAEFCKDVEVDTYCHPQSSWFSKDESAAHPPASGSKVPVDPLSSEPYFNLPKDGDKKFMICAKLEKDNSSLGNQMMPPGVNSGVYYCSTSQQ